MKTLTVLFLAVGLALSSPAQTKSLLNLDKSGVAIQGYDPVAFFKEGQPVMGKPLITSTYNGAIYQFASPYHKKVFDADPAKYEPVFGGYCAYGVCRNKLVEVDVEAFQIVDGKLLLQYSKGVRDTFNKDQQGNLAKANANWPGLVEKKGK
jgi:YHS domain-containing protein